VPQLNELATTYKDIAHFLSIYISEAHASDVWPLGNQVCVPQHNTIEDRIKVAKEQLIEKRDCKVPILVDSMDNQFDNKYHGWPERFYIIKGNIMQLVGMPSTENKGFKRKKIFEWLKSYQFKLNLNEN